MLPRFAAIVCSTIKIASFLLLINPEANIKVNGTKIIKATSFVIKAEMKNGKNTITRANARSLLQCFNKKSRSALKAPEDSNALEIPIREKSIIRTLKSIIPK